MNGTDDDGPADRSIQIKEDCIDHEEMSISSAPHNVSQCVNSEHLLRKKTFTTPVHCAVCSKLMWGIASNGYRCKVCKNTFHAFCVNVRPVSCLLSSSPVGELYSKPTSLAHNHIIPEAPQLDHKPSLNNNHSDISKCELIHASPVPSTIKSSYSKENDSSCQTHFKACAECISTNFTKIQKSNDVFTPPPTPPLTTTSQHILNDYIDSGLSTKDNSVKPQIDEPRCPLYFHSR